MNILLIDDEASLRRTMRTALETIATRVRRHDEQLRRLTAQKD